MEDVRKKIPNVSKLVISNALDKKNRRFCKDNTRC